VPLSLSEEVTVALNKDVDTGSCTGVVIVSDGNTLQIALRDRGIAVRPGTMVHLQSHAIAENAGWGAVERLEYAGDVKLLTLNSVHYETESKERAARLPIEIWLSANFHRDDIPQMTLGQSINLSLTGIRARFNKTVPEGTTIHTVLHLDEGKRVEAVARVVRIIPDSEGCEVGMEFQRFIKGYEFLVEAAADTERAAA